MCIDNKLASSAELDLTTVINDSSADEKGTDILTTELAPKLIRPFNMDGQKMEMYSKLCSV